MQVAQFEKREKASIEAFSLAWLPGIGAQNKPPHSDRSAHSDRLVVPPLFRGVPIIFKCNAGR
jgi:hypothetical protein